MLRRTAFIGIVTAVMGLGMLVPAAAKPGPEPAPDASEVPPDPSPTPLADVAQLEGGGFGNGSKWGLVDDAETCIDNYDDGGLGIEDASLNGSDFDDNDEAGARDDAFDDALMSFVDGDEFDDTTPSTDDATFYRSGPFSMSGLDVSVEYRTFASQPAIRQLVTFTNPSDAPITIEFGWGNETGSDSDTEVVGTGSGDLTSSPNDSYVTVHDGDVTESDPVVTFVNFGTGAALQPSGFDPDCDPLGGSGSSKDEHGPIFDVTVPAGQTVYLMFFAALDVDDATALAHAAELVNLCIDHEKIADLSAEVKASILNWAFPACPLTVLFTG